jgi:hypothetical protein
MLFFLLINIMVVAVVGYNQEDYEAWKTIKKASMPSHSDSRYSLWLNHALAECDSLFPGARMTTNQKRNQTTRSGSNTCGPTATSVSSLPYTDTGDNTGAPPSSIFSCDIGSSSSGAQWYQFTPAETASYQIDFSGFDGTHAVFTACNAGAEIACSDPSSLTTTLNSGTLYYIGVKGWGSSEGAYDFSVECLDCIGPIVATE